MRQRLTGDHMRPQEATGAYRRLQEYRSLQEHRRLQEPTGSTGATERRKTDWQTDRRRTTDWQTDRGRRRPQQTDHGLADRPQQTDRSHPTTTPYRSLQECREPTVDYRSTRAKKKRNQSRPPPLPR